MSNIFRPEALERLSSPDQLDKRITLVSPGTVLGFIAILLILLAALIWSITGTVVTSVGGDGLLTSDPAGVKVVAASQSGIVKEALLQPDAAFARGASFCVGAICHVSG